MVSIFLLEKKILAKSWNREYYFDCASYFLKDLQPQRRWKQKCFLKSDENKVESKTAGKQWN